MHEKHTLNRLRLTDGRAPLIKNFVASRALGHEKLVAIEII